MPIPGQVVEVTEVTVVGETGAPTTTVAPPTTPTPPPTVPAPTVSSLERTPPPPYTAQASTPTFAEILSTLDDVRFPETGGDFGNVGNILTNRQRRAVDTLCKFFKNILFFY